MALDLQEVRIIPGFNSTKTATLNQAGITDGAFVRYKDGLVEKLGGWAKFYPFPIGSIPRALLPWGGLCLDIRLAVGATARLQVITAWVLGAYDPPFTLA